MEDQGQDPLLDLLALSPPLWIHLTHSRAFGNHPITPYGLFWRMGLEPLTHASSVHATCDLRTMNPSNKQYRYLVGGTHVKR